MRARKGPLRLIRPLVYVSEELTTEYARAHGFLPIGCVCHDKEGARREIRDLLSQLAARHPGVPRSIEAALSNVNSDLLFNTRFPETAATAAASP